MAENLARQRALFRAALAQRDEERDAYLVRECGADRALLEAVRRLLAAHASGSSPVDAPAAGALGLWVHPDPGASEAELAHLRRRAAPVPRYRVGERIARGGMGEIFRVFDEDLRRDLAMKVIRGAGPDATAEPDAGAEGLDRFLAEAHVTGQLDHPGIVPVHELGIDGAGRVFFTMKLVAGETLGRVLDHVAAGAEDWTTTRAVTVLLRVCEAMAFAHERGVIHRDLKPDNVMVGRHGEVYVMDWGLARVLGTPELPAAPGRAGAPGTSPRLTIAGAVFGSPRYMAPEQAEGRVDEVGPGADVYATGAMLYRLLAGHDPYADEGTLPSAYKEVQRVVEKAPRPLHEIAPAAPAELLAIAERAMARRIQDRYPAMADLAADLRAFLEGKVVAAYETGAVAELKKWIQRNRGLASAAAALLLVLIGATAVVARKNADLSAANVEIQGQKAAVDASKAEFDQLAGVELLREAKGKEAELYPAWPENIPAMERWLKEDAAKLIAMKPVLETTLADLEPRALPWTDEQRAADRAGHPKLPELERKTARLMWLRGRLEALAAAAPLTLPALPGEMTAKSARALIAFVWERVNLHLEERLFGEELLALATALAALELVEAGDTSIPLNRVFETLACAQFANGRDADARSAIERAAAAAMEDERQRTETVRSLLEESIAAHSGTTGEATLAELEAEVAALDAEISARRAWHFGEASHLFLHGTLSILLADISAFEATGKAGVEQRLAWARRIGDLTLRHPNAHHTWADAHAAIEQADGIVASRLYAEVALDLVPQMGLVPIGMNPATKLWEFYDLRSACDVAAGQDPATLAIPKHAADGRLEVGEDTGIVFVLIPGGTFWMGAQEKDESAPTYDPGALSDESDSEGRAVVVALEPFLISRFELTQGQWLRIEGSNPSSYLAGKTYSDRRITSAHPVEQVSWYDCVAALRRMGFALPTEAQWEYACRAGTSTPWWTGRDKLHLSEAGNLADANAKRATPQWNCDTSLDDGFVVHAPVGAFRANPFGLHDTIGNVWEWCRDGYALYNVHARAGDGERPVESPRNRIRRGGSCMIPPAYARSTNRGWAAPRVTSGDIGCRPIYPLRLTR